MEELEKQEKLREEAKAKEEARKEVREDKGRCYGLGRSKKVVLYTLFFNKKKFGFSMLNFKEKSCSNT